MPEDLTSLIRSLELEVLRPETRESALRLDQLLSYDFLEFGESGKRYTKLQILDLLPKQREMECRIDDFKVTKISENTMLATYRLEKDGKSRSLRSSLWQFRDARWQIVFHQGTPQKDHA